MFLSVICLAAALVCTASGGSDMGFEKSVLKLTGAGEMEELEESVVEMFEALKRHPISLNGCGRGRLLSCGLFSRYQVASFLDYRQRCGDVMSLTELAAVDGFGEEFVAALKEFVILEGSPGRKRSGLAQSLTLKASARVNEKQVPACGGVKYHGELGDCLEVNWCDRNTYSEPDFGAGTFNAAVYGKRWLGKVIAGDYCARFGQGLLMWTGFSLSGVSSPGSLWRNGTGLTPSHSFSVQCRGLAADFNFGRWCTSAAFDTGGGILRGICNINRTGNVWQAGMTGIVESGRKAASFDWRLGFRNATVFGETALEKREGGGGVSSVAVACVFGALWTPSYGTIVSASARAYPGSFSGATSGSLRSSTRVSDENGISMGFQNRWMTATADAVRHPSDNTRRASILVHLKPGFKVGEVMLEPSFRAVWRNNVAADGTGRQRYDLRVDMGAEAGRFSLSARLNSVHCRDWSSMVYMEAGWKGAITLWVRGGAFRVDEWDDRIYVYERDAPGNFNVPVCYGRGWNASAVAGIKIGRCHSIWLRASAVEYPRMDGKDGKWEVKLQYTLSLKPYDLKISRE